LVLSQFLKTGLVAGVAAGNECEYSLGWTDGEDPVHVGESDVSQPVEREVIVLIEALCPKHAGLVKE
jgi:hypothetical protein